jgi:predicted phosphodiesterase
MKCGTGDIGNLSVLMCYKKVKPLRAVYGNIDDAKARFPLHNRFMCEGVDVWITYWWLSWEYNASIREELLVNLPKIFICGHSHILKVMFDKTKSLHLNPGAAGISGFHQYALCCDL